MKKDIEILEGLSSTECGCGEDDGHDCDNCAYCEARQVLNEIGEVVRSGLESVQQKIKPKEKESEEL